MQRFKNILVFYNGIPGDEATLTRAIALAKKNQSHLTVIEVISDGSNNPYQPGLLDERRAHLKRLIVSIKSDGVDVSSKVLNGTPFLEIILQVLRNKHDLVMMTADSVEGVKHLVFGSTSLHLMRKCPCPVWVTKPTIGQKYARIIAAIDIETSTPAEKALNIQILDHATSLAKTEGATLYVVHAWIMTGSDADTLKSEITEQMRESLVRKHELASRVKLEQLLFGYPMEDIDHKIHLIRSEPGLVIPEMATKQNVDLIVMGTICRTGVSGFFIGNTAETVLAQVDCSVLTVKPSGFVSPISLHD